VHFQRFGEALRIVQDKLDSRNFYAFNPAFDCECGNANSQQAK
jgi:spore coat protein JC